jgi:hypothetical protein
MFGDLKLFLKKKVVPSASRRGRAVTGLLSVVVENTHCTSLASF